MSSIDVRVFFGVDEVPQKEDVEFKDLLKMIEQFDDRVPKGVDKNQEFKRLFGGIVAEYFEEFQNGVLSGTGSNRTEEICNLFGLLRALESSKHVVLDDFLQYSGINPGNILHVAYQSEKKNTREYVANIITKIEEWKKTGKSLLNSIREYRKSGEARRELMSAKVPALDNKLLEELLRNTSRARRAEILVRIEKYIESGWFEVDKPLEKYFKGEQSVYEAVENLRSCMGERFFEAEVVQRHVGVHVSYSLELRPKDKLKMDVFEIAGTHQKDFAIFSPSGDKLFIGDITTDETGYTQNTSWTSLAHAVKNFKDNNPGIEVSASVTLPSLFYDHQFDGSIKQKFIEKISKNGFSQEDRNDFQYLIILAALDRDTQNFAYHMHDAMKDLSFSFIGSAAEDVCNSIVHQTSKDKFVDKSIEVASRVLNKLNSSSEVFNAQGVNTNVESVCLHVTVAAIKGLRQLVGNDEQKIAKYVGLKEGFENLEDKVVNMGHISTEIQNFRHSMAREAIQSDYERGFAKFARHKEEVERSLREVDKINKGVPGLISDIRTAVSNIVKACDSYVEPIYSARVGSEHNYANIAKGVLESIESATTLEGQIAGRGSVRYSKPTMGYYGNSDNTIKKAYREFARISSWQGVEGNCEIVIRAATTLLNVDEMHTSMFRVCEPYNTNGRTVYGNFLAELFPEYESNLNNIPPEKIDDYFENFKEEIGGRIAHLEELLGQYKLAKDQVQEFKKSAVKAM